MTAFVRNMRGFSAARETGDVRVTRPIPPRVPVLSERAAPPFSSALKEPAMPMVLEIVDGSLKSRPKRSLSIGLPKKLMTRVRFPSLPTLNLRIASLVFSRTFFTTTTGSANCFPTR